MYGNPSPSAELQAIKEKIEAVPRAMRRMGWTVSASLMDRWLQSPAWRLPEAWKGAFAPDPRSMALPHLDQNIVRMAWAMRSPRITAAMCELRSRMANEAARKLLVERLENLPWADNSSIRIGDRELNAIQLEGVCHSNSVGFGGNLDTMDDLYGSIGKGTLKVALVGEAKRDPKTGRKSLRVTDVGFYIRDSYDFNGPQYLGTWTSSGVSSKGRLLMNAVADGLTFRWGRPAGHLENQDFESYRRATGFGGDFVIYSDVHWESANVVLDLS